MTLGTVYFRFKHQKGFDRIEFEGTEISVAELKLKIIEKLVLVEKYSHESSIQLYHPSGDRNDTNSYGDIYEFDNELVLANTSVLVFRTPTKAVGAKITVANSEFFPTKVSPDIVPFGALKASVIAHERDQLKRVPDGLICSLCRYFMTPPDHTAMILHCCGLTVCRACVVGKQLCPLDESHVCKFTLNRGLGRLAEIVRTNSTQFAFDEGVLFSEQIDLDTQPQPGVEEECVDLDEVVDVEKPLTAKELEQIERRARRKRKATELLLKKEGKTVKGELTETEIAKLLKQEIKQDLDDLGISGQNGPVFNIRRSILEFPKLLTLEEFTRWKSVYYTFLFSLCFQKCL